MADANDQGRTPLDQLLDLVFYAPLGFIMNADEVVPQLVERGRQQVQMARMFGQFAVQQGQHETKKLFERIAPKPAPPRPDPASAPSGAPAPARAGVPAAPTPSTATTAPAVETLAIPDYDSLSASQVVPRLAGLSTSELEAVRSYETANRGRKTILNKVAQLQSA